MKNNTKNTKKSLYVVNLTDVKTPADVKVAYIEAKATNGVRLSVEEINYLILVGVNIANTLLEESISKYEKEVPTYIVKDDKLYKKLEDIINEAKGEKKPWYKRFWNWITKPFKK